MLYWVPAHRQIEDLLPDFHCHAYDDLTLILLPVGGLLASRCWVTIVAPAFVSTPVAGRLSHSRAALLLLRS
jgi:hypothetical protein